MKCFIIDMIPFIRTSSLLAKEMSPSGHISSLTTSSFNILQDRLWNRCFRRMRYNSLVGCWARRRQYVVAISSGIHLDLIDFSGIPMRDKWKLIFRLFFPSPYSLTLARSRLVITLRVLKLCAEKDMRDVWRDAQNGLRIMKVFEKVD